MTTAVPAVITRYVRTAEQSDIDALAGCFTEDAVVEDDGATMTGHAQIRAWREALTHSFTYTTEVLSAEPLTEDTFLTTARVTGDFAGSPVDLRYVFTLRDDLIAALTIAP